MSEEGSRRQTREFATGAQQWHERVPRIEDALRKATFATVKLNDESEIQAVICDSSAWGILLDLHEPSNSERDGSIFVPWTSVKHVIVPSNTERRKPGDSVFSE